MKKRVQIEKSHKKAIKLHNFPIFSNFPKNYFSFSFRSSRRSSGRAATLKMRETERRQREEEEALKEFEKKKLAQEKKKKTQPKAEKEYKESKPKPEKKRKRDETSSEDDSDEYKVNYGQYTILRISDLKMLFLRQPPSVMPEPKGPGQGPLAPPISDNSVNPIPSEEGRLSPSLSTGTPNVFHLPASLKYQYSLII